MSKIFKKNYVQDWKHFYLGVLLAFQAHFTRLALVIPEKSNTSSYRLAVLTTASVLAEVLQAWAHYGCKISVCILQRQPFPSLFTGVWIQGSFVAEKLTNLWHPLVQEDWETESADLDQSSVVYHFTCGLNFACINVDLFDLDFYIWS